MPDIAKVLKEEVARLTKREVKGLVEPVAGQVRTLKQIIREQKKDILQLQRELAQKANRGDYGPIQAPLEREVAIRIGPSSIRKHRERLGLSQRELGLLLEVSTLTVSKWETGKASPRGKNRRAFAEFRKLGVREARERLSRIQN